MTCQEEYLYKVEVPLLENANTFLHIPTMRQIVWIAGQRPSRNIWSRLAYQAMHDSLEVVLPCPANRPPAKLPSSVPHPLYACPSTPIKEAGFARYCILSPQVISGKPMFSPTRPCLGSGSQVKPGLPEANQNRYAGKARKIKRSFESCCGRLGPGAATW